MRHLITVLILLLLQNATAHGEKAEVVEIEVKATPAGFEPNVISADPGKRVKLIVTRSPASSCNTDIRIPDKKIKRKLPRKKSISINLGVLEKGSLRFGCGKEMNEPGIIYVK
jgi:plastocyanin domain-containing protein